MVALIDAGVPEPEESEYNWAILLSIFAFDLGLTEGNFTKPELWTPLPQMAQLRQLWVEARRAKVVPSEMTLVEFRKLFDIFKIYANAVRGYRPRQYKGRVTLFLPADDVEQVIFTKGSDDAPEEQKPNKLDPLKGWGSFAEGVDVHIVPGNHFSILKAPDVQFLGEKLRQCMDETRAQRRALGQ